MRAVIPLPQRGRTVRLSAGVWLVAFFSPTVYFLLLLFANRFQVPSPPESLVVSLFCLIPAVALLICESVVWRWSMTVGCKIGGMLFTLLAMLLQFNILVVVIRAILIAVTGYAQ